MLIQLRSERTQRPPVEYKGRGGDKTVGNARHGECDSALLKRPLRVVVAVAVTSSGKGVKGRERESWRAEKTYDRERETPVDAV